MKTTYFANVKKLGDMNFVSIARKTPDGFPGIIYEPLAPTWEILQEYKYGQKDKRWYIEKYIDDVLSRLNPRKVIDIIGEDAVLCCWETPEKFCHRHIVAKWFEQAGYKVEEILQNVENKA